MPSARVLLVEYVRLLLEEGDHGFTSDVASLLGQRGLDVGPLLGQGLHGSAYEFGPGRVIKVSVAKDARAAEEQVRSLKALQDRNSSALVAMYDAGVLGPVSLSSDRWVTKDGVAFYYVMERVFELPEDERRLATRLLNDLVAAPGEEKKTVFVARRVFKRDGEDPEIVDRTLRVFRALQADGIKHRDINRGALMANAAGDYKLVDTESASVMA